MEKNGLARVCDLPLFTHPFFLFFFLRASPFDQCTLLKHLFPMRDISSIDRDRNRQKQRGKGKGQILVLKCGVHRTMRCFHPMVLPCPRSSPHSTCLLLPTSWLLLQTSTRKKSCRGKGLSLVTTKMGSRALRFSVRGDFSCVLWLKAIVVLKEFLFVC